MRNVAAMLLTALAVISLLVIGCGGADEESAYLERADAPALGFATDDAGPMAQKSMPLSRSGPLDFLRQGGVESEQVVVTEEVMKEVPVEVVRQSAPAAPAPGAPGSSGSAARVSEPLAKQFGFDQASVQAALVQQERIIVRTVDMALKVENVAASIDEVADVAGELGGWMVSSDRSSTHRGTVSIRVPAQNLEDAVLRIRQIGLEVESESTNSQDVTDEYVDSRSRLTGLRATEEALLDLFERANAVEDALAVQTELAKLRAEIEALLGRIKYLEETAAFSLVNVSMEAEAATMDADAGDDRAINVGEPARFRATFTPPADLDEFDFTWDFGDGSEPVTGSRTVPSTQTGQRVTATVHHTYHDDLESPYIVSFDITAAGDAGYAKGSDTFVATVKEIPTIDVFVQGPSNVEAGSDVEFTGSFTRPVELSNFEYAWNFGDGSPVVDGVPGEGVTQTSVTHRFDTWGVWHLVELTITADSEAGEVSESRMSEVYVYESQGLIIGGWSAGSNAKGAVRALSVVVQVMGTVLIWALIFTPVWLILAALVIGVRRSFRWLRRGRRASDEQTPTDIPPTDSSERASGDAPKSD